MKTKTAKPLSSEIQRTDGCQSQGMDGGKNECRGLKDEKRKNLSNRNEL